MSNLSFKIKSFATPSAFDPHEINGPAGPAGADGPTGAAGSEFSDFLVSTGGTATVDVGTFLVLAGTASARNVVFTGTFTTGVKGAVKSIMSDFADVSIEADSELIEDIGSGPGTFATSTTLLGVNRGQAVEFTYMPINATGSAFVYSSAAIV